ncbi:MAG: ComF family protein [Planctomycetaceae bacterium]
MLSSHLRIPVWLGGLARAAADFVYPPACRLCDAEFAPPEQPPPPFCETCRAELEKSHGPACVRCGATVGPHLDPHRRCMYCRNESFAFERVVRLGVYDGLLRTACLRAKQQGAEPVVAGLAELTWTLERTTLQAAQVDVVVPVPGHWTRRLAHPHSAAHVLAREWAKRLQVAVEGHILRKVRRTPLQARLGPSERRVNLRRAFAITAQNAFAGARVLLADDVMTTGTTAHEAARVLKQAGAAGVIVAVVARGLGRR